MIRFSKTWIIILILAVILPFWTIWIASINWEPILIYPLVTSYVAAIVIAWVAGGNKFSYMRLFFWVYVYIMFGLSALAQVSLNSWPWPGYYATVQISETYGIVWIGLVAYEIGYSLRAWNKKDSRTTATTLIPQPQNQGNPGIKQAVLCIFLAIASYGFLFSREVPIFALRNEYSTQLLDSLGTVGHAVILLFTQYLPLLSLLWVITEYKSHLIRQQPKLFYFLIGGILLIVLGISSNPIIAARWWFSTVFISLLLIFWGKSKKTLFLLGLTIPIAYTLLFPYLDLFRTEETFEKVTSSSRSSFLQNFTKGDFDSLQQTMNAQVYVEYQGITFGRQLLGVFAYWIPREVWADKPVDTGIMVAEFLGYSFKNLSSPLWAEGLVNFGLIGVILFLGIWGYVSILLDKVFQSDFITSQHYPVWILPSFYMLVPAQNLLIRGSLLITTLYISSPILIVMGWTWIDRIIRLFTLSKYQKNLTQGSSIDSSS